MQINNLEKFRAKVDAGKLCLGMVVSLSDPAVSELAGDTGMDFTWLDMEHGPLSIETGLLHCMALRGTDTAPFLRVAGNDPFIIKPLLELAPAGVIIPMVNSAAEAEAAVKSCRYPPRGIRGCGPRRGTRFGMTPFADYLDTSEHDPMVIIQIEHINALKEIDKILAVEGIDSICVGPYDLSSSMGKLKTAPDDPEVQAVIDQVCACARRAGVMIGSVSGTSPASINKWRQRGAHWLAVCGDCGNIAAASRKAMDEVAVITRAAPGGNAAGSAKRRKSNDVQSGPYRLR